MKRLLAWLIVAGGLLFLLYSFGKKVVEADRAACTAALTPPEMPDWLEPEDRPPAAEEIRLVGRGPSILRYALDEGGEPAR